jgi:hypothetical protein
MHRLILFRALPSCLALLAATGAPAQAPAVASLRDDVAWLSAPERRGRGPDPSLAVPRWIAARFRAVGLKPLWDESYLGPFTIRDERGTNVGALLPGQGWPKERRHVIVSAHWDHLGVRGGEVHPGAADNAAGVAVLLGLAEDLVRRAKPLPQTVVFLSFDLEERGMLGSRAYAERPALPLEDLTVFTTMDILGRGVLDLPGDRLVVLGWERSPELLPLGRALGVDGLDSLALGSDVIGNRSDYVPFRDRSIPFLFFTCGENRDYHRPSDTLENLDLRTLEQQMAGIRVTVERIAALEKRPPFLPEAVCRREEADDFLRIIDAFLQVPGALPESLRDRVAEVRRQIARRLEDGEYSPSDRDFMRASVRALLLGFRMLR